MQEIVRYIAVDLMELQTAVKLPCTTSETPVETTTNRRFLALGATVQNQ